MQAILIYDLPEEKDDLEYALKAVDMNLVIHDFQTWLRNELKYVEHTEEEYALLEKFETCFGNP